MTAIEDLEVLIAKPDLKERQEGLVKWAERWLAEVSAERVVTHADLAGKTAPEQDAILHNTVRDLKHGLFTMIGNSKEAMFYMVKPAEEGFTYMLALTLLQRLPTEPEERGRILRLA